MNEMCFMFVLYIIFRQLTAFQLSDHLIWLQPKSDKFTSHNVTRKTDRHCLLFITFFFQFVNAVKYRQEYSPLLGPSSTMENYLVIHDEQVFGKCGWSGQEKESLSCYTRLGYLAIKRICSMHQKSTHTAEGFINLKIRIRTNYKLRACMRGSSIEKICCNIPYIASISRKQNFTLGMHSRNGDLSSLILSIHTVCIGITFARTNDTWPYGAHNMLERLFVSLKHQYS